MRNHHILSVILKSLYESALLLLLFTSGPDLSPFRHYSGTQWLSSPIITLPLAIAEKQPQTLLARDTVSLSIHAQRDLSCLEPSPMTSFGEDMEMHPALRSERINSWGSVETRSSQ